MNIQDQIIQLPRIANRNFIARDVIIKRIDNRLTNTRVNTLRTTGIISVKMWFIPGKMDTSKWDFEYMTSFFMHNFTANCTLNK